MRLLVSVSDGAEALSALVGGADIIDAKNPLAGPLGAVTGETFRAIERAVGGARPLTAALGDARDAASIGRAAREFASAGAQLVKVGFAGIDSEAHAAHLLRSAVRGASSGANRWHGAGRDRTTGVVAVAYADAERAASLSPDALVRAAATAGASGVLLDTFDKQGPGLRQLLTIEALMAWVETARQGGRLVALAGRVGAADIAWVRASGADVVGVRGAACVGGRHGRVTSANVRHLHALCSDAGVNDPTDPTDPNDPNDPNAGTIRTPERSERSERSTGA